MIVVDARRLTGPNLELSTPHGEGPGAVVEVGFEPGEDADAALARVRANLAAALARITHPHPLRERRWANGAAFAVAGQIDRLYALVDLIEAAAKLAASGEPLDDQLETLVDTHWARAAVDSNAPLIALQAAAQAHGVPFFWDDDEVSLGMGAHSATWPARAVPDVHHVALDWSVYRAIPTVFITGTNGKTTTSRLLTRILSKAGYVPGLSSTDAITVGEQRVEKGDWTGPGAARKVLRHPEVTAAVLETARGGMLRRGLAFAHADVGLVTNVGADHFGEHGITDLPGMASAKGIVWTAVRAGGTRILNADDVHSVRYARIHFGLATDDAGTRWILFGLDPQSELLASHRRSGGRVLFADTEALYIADGPVEETLVRIADLPIAFGGAARHNVANALAAASAALALGVDRDVVRRGLTDFGRVPDDNPGRAELYKVGDLRVFMDFGHNPHGVAAVRGIWRHLLAQAPDSRLLVGVGQAGDRSDHDLAELMREIIVAGPSRIHLRQLPGYERGRSLAEVVTVLRQFALQLGMTPDNVVDVADELASLDAAMLWARPGDVIVHLVHIERDEVRRWLAEHGAVPA